MRPEFSYKVIFAGQAPPALEYTDCMAVCWVSYGSPMSTGWESNDGTFMSVRLWNTFPDSKVHGANMGPTWVLSSPGGPHVGPKNLAIWVVTWYEICVHVCDIWVWQAWRSNYILLDIAGCTSLSIHWWLYIIILWNFPDNKVHGANMGPTGPRWAPCGPREPCYLGYFEVKSCKILFAHILFLHVWRPDFCINASCFSVRIGIFAMASAWWKLIIWMHRYQLFFSYLKLS